MKDEIFYDFLNKISGFVLIRIALANPSLFDS